MFQDQYCISDVDQSMAIKFIINNISYCSYILVESLQSLSLLLKLIAAKYCIFVLNFVHLSLQLAS